MTTQSSACWQLEIICQNGLAFHYADMLDELAGTVSCFEDEANAAWVVRFFSEHREIIKQAEKLIASSGDAPHYSIEKLADTDWVSETQKRFKPFSIGCFFVHSSYYREDIAPNDQIAIEVDAQMAFGTGEHETTSGCLSAISELAAKGYAPKNILDIGCGSGILSVAAGKVWPQATLTVSDIDMNALLVAQENIKLNTITNKTVVVHSDGYNAAEITALQPYDLILCNILAEPLMILAPQLAAHLEKDALCVLSGLLDEQEHEVQQAHEQAGLSLEKRYALGKWVTLVMQK